MNDGRLLTPHEAEAVVDERIDRFGAGALPRIEVAASTDGNWQVRWEHLVRNVTPMTQRAWCAWLEENVGSLDAGDLQTTES